MTTETPPPPADRPTPAEVAPSLSMTLPPPPAEPPVAAPGKRTNPLVAGLLGLAVGAGLVGGIWAYTANRTPEAPPMFTLKGTFTLTDGALKSDDGGCLGSGGFDDIAEGTSVTVYDAAGDVVATGNLGKSTYAAGLCLFKVSVDDVPKGEKFYQVEVSHRGNIKVAAREAEKGEFAATLG